MKVLKDILYKCGSLSAQGDTWIKINGLAFDSREVKKGFLFIALAGEQSDGHQYIGQAIEKGAWAVVCEKMPDVFKDNVTYILVQNSHYALGIIASNYFDNPSEHIKIIGITGTNGKTTTATLLYNLFTQLGYKCGLVSTIRILIDGKEYNTSHTTPDALKLNEMFCRMKALGVTYCFMEVSSHAVQQHRIAGVRFSGGVFTNLTHDHLDYHKTFAAYRDAKKAFFDSLMPDAFALSNADDKNGKVMLQNTQAKCYFYGLKKMCDYKGKILESHFSGTNIRINNDEFWAKLIGIFNVYNIMAVYAAAILAGADKYETLRILSMLEPVEGRFEYIKNAAHITAVVDYAHTPDALQNILTTINSLRSKNEKLITVVGCGGNRDKNKRPVMARIAGELSDNLILTSDNPRFEEPEQILEDMYRGIDVVLKKKTLVITDRKQAINTACKMAREGDIILVAGKGHEKYQEIKGVKYPFDDMDILSQFLNE